MLHVMRAGLANKDGLYILKLVLFTFPTTYILFGDMTPTPNFVLHCHPCDDRFIIRNFRSNRSCTQNISMLLENLHNK